MKKCPPTGIFTLIEVKIFMSKKSLWMIIANSKEMYVSQDFYDLS